MKLNTEPTPQKKNVYGENIKTPQLLPIKKKEGYLTYKFTKSENSPFAGKKNLNAEETSVGVLGLGMGRVGWGQKLVDRKKGGRG